MNLFYGELRVNKKIPYSSLIILCALATLIITSEFYFQQNIYPSDISIPISHEPPVVENGDTVSMNYTVWVANETGSEGEFDMDAPYEGPIHFATVVSPNNLVYGFYLNILGMGINETKLFDLPPNIDENGDGYDDFTNEVVQSYTTGDFANTKLRFNCTILTIIKQENEDEEEAIDDNQSSNNETIEDYIVPSLNSSGEGARDGENVRMEYTLWIANQTGSEGVINTSSPYQGPDNFTSAITPQKLIYGYYLNVLGMEEGESKTFDLPANNDTDGDGFDDSTGLKVLSYGRPSSELFNTKLRFRVIIITIYRFDEEDDNTSLDDDFENSNSIREIINKIPGYSPFLLVLTIFITVSTLIIQKKR